jgi:putative ABC transport system substrate-binding protein
MSARRGALVVLLAVSLLGQPFTADAQQAEKVHRVGVLGATSACAYAIYLDAFRQGLRDVGYVEGKNIVLESRWADGKYERLPGRAVELLQSKVKVIVTHGPVGARAAKEATKTVPIVMATVGDAAAVGLVASLSRPGGNITGSTFGPSSE